MALETRLELTLSHQPHAHRQLVALLVFVVVDSLYRYSALTVLAILPRNLVVSSKGCCSLASIDADLLAPPQMRRPC